MKKLKKLIKENESAKRIAEVVAGVLIAFIIILISFAIVSFIILSIQRRIDERAWQQRIYPINNQPIEWIYP